MSAFTDPEKERLMADVADIKRGLYGDTNNKTKGIVERVGNIEMWITKSNLKIAYVSGGILVVVVAFKAAWAWMLSWFDGSGHK